MTQKRNEKCCGRPEETGSGGLAEVFAFGWKTRQFPYRYGSENRVYGHTSL